MVQCPLVIAPYTSATSGKTKAANAVAVGRNIVIAVSRTAVPTCRGESTSRRATRA
jgi:hypothetical protein